MAKEPQTPAGEQDAGKNLPPGHITMENASRLLMISTERIRQLIKQGYVPRAPQKGIVSIQGAVQGYINFLKDDQRVTVWKQLYEDECNNLMQQDLQRQLDRQAVRQTP